MGSPSNRRIVVFGATGYTGRLVTEALLDRDAKPLAVGRSRDKLEELAYRLGPLDFAVADASEPAQLAALLEPGDVLVTTVGPFTRYGDTAVSAACSAGAHYIDSTGEPPFIRRVFEYHARKARGACALLPAFGYDYVPGNLAGALALKRAGKKARRVDVGYFNDGPVGRDVLSSGTLASAMGVLGSESYAWRDGHLVSERPARSVRDFVTADGRSRPAISVGGTEHWGLPRQHPELTEVGVYLGWVGPLGRGVQAMSAGAAALSRLPGVEQLMQRATEPLARTTGHGPDAESRSQRKSVVVAVALDGDGNELARVELHGPEGYTFTGDIMAWAAEQAAAHGFDNSGALTPVDAFGIDRLEAGCAEVGLVRV